MTNKTVGTMYASFVASVLLFLLLCASTPSQAQSCDYGIPNGTQAIGGWCGNLSAEPICCVNDASGEACAWDPTEQIYTCCVGSGTKENDGTTNNCTKDTDCCFGFCNNPPGTCCSYWGNLGPNESNCPSTRDVPPGYACVHNSDCTTGYCVDMEYLIDKACCFGPLQPCYLSCCMGDVCMKATTVSAQKPNTCCAIAGQNPVATACTIPADCCSNNCDVSTGVCQCNTQVGTPCQVDEDCCSAHLCVNQKCSATTTCITLGNGTCTQDTDCCTGYTCNNGLCLGQMAEFASCTENANCYTWLACSDNFSDYFSFNGAVPQTPGTCLVPNGGACNSGLNRECVTALCQNKKCISCTQNSQCAAGEACNTIFGNCCGEPGASCANGAECCSAFCLGGACRSSNRWCGTTADCETGYTCNTTFELCVKS